MNPDNLYKLALIVLLVLALVQIYNYIYRKPTVIETTEHMNPALLTHQYEDLAREPSPNVPIQFYVKEDRYNAEQEYQPVLQDPLSKLGEGVPCGPQMDWNDNMNPGANNTYGDLIWHETSPKMVVEKSGCMSCHRKNQMYNEPSGVASGLTSGLGDINVIGSLANQDLRL